MKICLRDIKRLLAPVMLFLSPYERYFAGLSVFCFPKTNPNIQRFRTLSSFFHGIDYDEFFVNANCKSMKHVQSCLFSNETFCFHTWTRLQTIQIAVKNQCKKKARRYPLCILNLPFQHNHNSLRVHCASYIFHSHLTTIPYESIAHPKSLSRA